MDPGLGFWFLGWWQCGHSVKILEKKNLENLSLLPYVIC